MSKWQRDKGPQPQSSSTPPFLLQQREEALKLSLKEIQDKYYGEAKLVPVTALEKVCSLSLFSFVFFAILLSL